MSIYPSLEAPFEPTFLYIKRHSVTGKCYFGKTTSSNPKSYKGSGKYWKRHIKVHGREHVETIWFKLFTDREECTRVALLFSEQQDIVKSDLWLNFKPENGLDGGFEKGQNLGKLCSAETRAKISIANKGSKRPIKAIEQTAAANKGRKNTEETKARMSASAIGRKSSDETKAKLSELLKLRGKLECPHCGLKASPSNAKRWHFENCKAKKSVD
jgi:hypothetical protein